MPGRRSVGAIPPRTKLPTSLPNAICGIIAPRVLGVPQIPFLKVPDDEGATQPDVAVQGAEFRRIHSPRASEIQGRREGLKVSASYPARLRPEIPIILWRETGSRATS